jgi:ribosomal protein S18 acetylase RimI-like enzyme
MENSSSGAILPPPGDPVRVEPLRREWLSTLVDIHMSAFQGYMNTRLGKLYVLRFLAWFMDAPDGIALAAIDGVRPVGYVVGAPLGYKRCLTRATLPAAAAGVLVRPWVLFQGEILKTALEGIYGLFIHRKDPLVGVPEELSTLSLVGIGVAPESRGRQAGRALMEGFEAAARARGAHRMRLSVYPTNASARALYEKAGWTLLSDPSEDTLYYHRYL